MENRRRFLHAQELGVAQLCAITLNLNRDPKKQRKPFQVSDFCFHLERDENKPETRAAAAYWKLIETERMPSWALFCLADFREGKGRAFLTDPAFVAEGLLLLAPQETEHGLKGVMIAAGPASGARLAGDWEGHRLLVQVPEFKGAVVAQGDVELIILRQLADGAQP